MWATGSKPPASHMCTIMYCVVYMYTAEAYFAFVVHCASYTLLLILLCKQLWAVGSEPPAPTDAHHRITLLLCTMSHMCQFPSAARLYCTQQMWAMGSEPPAPPNLHQHILCCA